MSTQSVLDHHLAAFSAGDVDETMKDYDDSSVFISGNGIARGRDEIAAVFTRLYGGLFAPGTYEFTMDMSHVEGDVAYIAWHMSGANADIALGTDTFVIRDGVIVTQTVAVSVQPKAG